MSRCKSSVRFFGGTLLITLAITSAGCNDGMCRVTGTVTFDGQKVTKSESQRCEVTLKPLGGGPAATGSVDESGRFRLSVGSSNAVPPGEYAASVRYSEVIQPPKPGGYAKSRPLAPKRFGNSATSGLRYVLDPGSNEIVIELTSQ